MEPVTVLSDAGTAHSIGQRGMRSNNDDCNTVKQGLVCVYLQKARGEIYDLRHKGAFARSSNSLYLTGEVVNLSEHCCSFWICINNVQYMHIQRAYIA